MTCYFFWRRFSISLCTFVPSTCWARAWILINRVCLQLPTEAECGSAATHRTVLRFTASRRDRWKKCLSRQAPSIGAPDSKPHHQTVRDTSKKNNKKEKLMIRRTNDVWTNIKNPRTIFVPWTRQVNSSQFHNEWGNKNNNFRTDTREPRPVIGGLSVFCFPSLDLIFCMIDCTDHSLLRYTVWKK